AQRRLWFLERLESGAGGPADRRRDGAHRDGERAWGKGGRGGGTYVIPLAVRLSGALDRAALSAALCDLAERHESLRTLFPERLGVPRQLILAAAAALGGRGELIVEAAAARVPLETGTLAEADVAAALTAVAGRGFDLAGELPLR